MVKLRWRTPSNCAYLAPDGFKELPGALVFVYQAYLFYQLNPDCLILTKQTSSFEAIV